ncbi:hypothetical protein AB0P45_18415 [Streptomyces niveus]|uniref:hypothetical protein n=1 Tax=Streptomyces niveus TaxID=193462 RepID=UPI0033CF71EF
MNKVIRSTAIGVSALALAFFSFPATAQAAQSAPAGALAKLSHATAASQLSNAGIGISSSGGCSNRNNPTCTSLDQVNSATIQGAITLKNASGCGLTVTGGTETGHASGTYSHWNGYKLDFSMTSCLTNYVTRNFTSIGGSKWQSGAGNIYYNEVNHWDVTFYNCGGC